MNSEKIGRQINEQTTEVQKNKKLKNNLHPNNKMKQEIDCGGELGSPMFSETKFKLAVNRFLPHHQHGFLFTLINKNTSCVLVLMCLEICGYSICHTLHNNHQLSKCHISATVAIPTATFGIASANITI